MQCARFVELNIGVYVWIGAEEAYSVSVLLLVACCHLHVRADQFSVIEKLATEFQRDPLTFCWLDLTTQPADKRTLWQTQFGNAPARTLLYPLFISFFIRLTHCFA